ncbi:hypothetical protein COCNU_02G001710 [Cocos nucifera]|uniref:Uncharacterized protein n=1 Tax=Cocos nucifera TaxID=13894 RepID=A0A8K0HXR4_COCNU|nr:hypothetical protein COCNU_02G001710 [Cocos nucifera]
MLAKIMGATPTIIHFYDNVKYCVVRRPRLHSLNKIHFNEFSSCSRARNVRCEPTKSFQMGITAVNGSCDHNRTSSLSAALPAYVTCPSP